ncbi:helix-turn-helix domain-containing protein [Streptomyces smyrnaeus]|uniref:helix-turn-helix domain-containing protein n=1 Tax=Streptomyces smyrnaeus TaxID=1387713 RepID=UPI003694A06D
MAPPSLPPSRGPVPAPGRAAHSKPEERPAIWVAYGKLLRRFRKRAALTQEQLAERMRYSVDQLASVEQGRRPATARFTKAAERVLDAGGALEDLQEEVDLAKLPAFFRDFATIEMQAVSRFSCDPLLVPGLLQTPEYARAVLEGHVPLLDSDTVENSIDGRISRQKILTKVPLVSFSFVIGETALREEVGSAEVMRGQYEHLLSLGQLRNVEIQMMPSGTGFHPGMDGPMVLVETQRHHQYGYLESQNIGQVISDSNEVSMLAQRYGKLRARALSEDQSAAFIRQLRGDL